METSKDEIIGEELNDDETLEIPARTPEEMEEIFRLANIKESEVANLIQSLYSLEPLDKPSEHFKVLEIDDHLLENFKVGDIISFRGDPDEPAVLCSDTRTYEVKDAETSNTCLVVPNLKSEKEAWAAEQRVVENVKVEGMFRSYLETRECSPRLSKLSIVLEPSSFKGLEYENSIDPSTLYDWNRIQREIQASDGEILAALPEYLVVCMDGFYRLISFEFEARALPLMIDLIDENSWEFDEVEKETSCESLIEIIPEPIFELLFKKYTEPSDKKAKNGSPLYKYNVPKTSRLLAQILLTACPTNDYDDFMEAWKVGSPDCIPPKREYLHGIAVIVQNKLTKRNEVTLFPEANLPDNLNKRLNELFQVKEKWTFEEISPYLSKFTSRTQDVKAILTKYTRASTINNIKYYSAKHGK